jgi:hypothetical protein
LPGSSGELRLSANTFFIDFININIEHIDIMPGSSEELRLSANTEFLSILSSPI